MSYQCIHTFPGRETEQLFHEVINRLYPADKRPLVASGINWRYLQNMIVLTKNGIPCGRLAVYFNSHMSGGTWMIGNYECIEDKDAAKILLDEAEKVIREKGGKTILGPMNGSTWDDHRFTVSWETALFFTEVYRHRWYAQQFTANGFKTKARYFSAKDTTLTVERPEKSARKKELEKNGIVFRNIDMNLYEDELKKMFPFITKTFEGNYLYSPISEKDFIEKYLSVKNYIHPDFVVLAEEANGETAGVFFCLPDYFNSDEKGLVIKTIARKNSPGLKGLGQAMAEVIYHNASLHNMSYIIHAFMHQENISLNISQQYSGEAFKQYKLYEKEI